MDYFEIRQRIRKIRKARGFSQEQLAEAVGISVTHMSHIETANTKLSLAVLVEIAQALDARIDDLVFSPPRDSVGMIEEEIAEILKGCDGRQARIIRDLVKAAKQAMDAYL